MMENLVECAKHNFTASKWYDFGTTIYFDSPIENYDYYSQIRNRRGELIVDIDIIKGYDAIVLYISQEELKELPTGSYFYDIKRVNIATNYQVKVIEGDFIINDGRTQTP
jgi:hypothetical protein